MTRDEARDALEKEIAAVPNANIVETLIRIVLDERTRNSELVEGIKDRVATWRKRSGNFSRIHAYHINACADELESLLTPDPVTERKEPHAEATK